MRIAVKMKWLEIPTLKASVAARFDAETIRGVAARLKLEFSGGVTDLPPFSVVTVAVSEPFHPGDPVAAATCDGATFTGFYRRCGGESVIESLHHRKRLCWNDGDKSCRIRWIFLIVRVVVPCFRFRSKEKLRSTEAPSGVLPR